MRRLTGVLIALLLAGCGGSAESPDAFARKCIESFNKGGVNTRDWVAKSGRDPAYGPKAEEDDFRAPVWFGPSKRNPEKCLAVVGLGGDDTVVTVRENLNAGGDPGEWFAIPGSDEGTVDELIKRVKSPNALGNKDGTVEPQ